MKECVSTPQLLTNLETCPRKGYFSARWTTNKLPAKEMVIRALDGALRAQEGQWGDVAGTQVLQDAEDRGLDTDSQNIYDEVVHLAALSDILVSAIRKPDDESWLIPDKIGDWISSAYLSPDGRNLRRIVLVSHWTDARHYSECRGWYSMGEIAHYKLPMQLVVLVIGQERSGKRHTPWTSGYLHPMNHELRFRKRSKGFRSEGNVFNDRWEKIWREDHDEISRETWLQSMLKDDVLPQVCFRVDIPVPDAQQCKRILDLATRKLDRLHKMTEKPEPSLSSCDWPTPCMFRKLCHQIPEREPSEKNGYLNISS